MSKIKNFIPVIKQHLSDQDSFGVRDLQQVLSEQGEEITISALRWWLYQLTKEGIIGKVGYGRYKIGSSNAPDMPISTAQQRIDLQIKRNFPQLGFCQWSTAWIHQFMRHQPATHLNIIEIEREACESVFNMILDVKAKVFLMPDKKTLETVVFNFTSPTIIIPLITESPLDKRSEVRIPRLEKIIVDLIAEKDLYIFYQGQELKNILNEISKKYQLNIDMMTRYAKRRNKLIKLQKYLQESDYTRGKR